jgi:2-(1,2-epoxy-1,2-dihydrophenyl)acetyl-CoA isomerase
MKHDLPIDGTQPAMTEPIAPLLYQRDGAIARIRFNRPEVLNAIDATMARAFRDACRAIAGDPEVRVVVVSGEGRDFMVGGDVAQFLENPAAIPATLIDPMHEGLRLLTELRAPVLASLHGAVAGAGMSLALACDLAIAAEGTKFNLAYAKLSASCDLGASWSLPRLVGLRRALEIALLCETLDAAEALRLGLVNRVVPPEALAAETERLAVRLASGAPLANGLLKRLLRASLSRDLPTQLQEERDGFARCATTQDFGEGVSAFLEKRPANFQGR